MKQEKRDGNRGIGLLRLKNWTNRANQIYCTKKSKIFLNARRAVGNNKALSIRMVK